MPCQGSESFRTIVIEKSTGIQLLLLGESFQAVLVVMNPAANAGDIRDQVASLEKGMATHSSILALRISWTEEPGEL